VVCPRCGSEAFYRYGRDPRGKQRFLCLLCGKQFTDNSRAVAGPPRRICPQCGSKMYVYNKGDGMVRYRCSRYPACRTYFKDVAEVTG
jgi:transposase-like protein